MRVVKLRFMLLLLLLCPFMGMAQYYDQGQSPASVRWSSLKSDWLDIIYPENYTLGAIKILNTLDTIRCDVSYGFEYGPMRSPVVLRTQNFLSNGLVILAPKRMEFVTNPLGASTASSWYKQLSAHEYRHSVQFNNTNRGLIKVLGYMFGQQGQLLGGIILPNWMMEGDAVLAETQMTSFGRALQPSFTIEYRAMMGEGLKRYRADKYFCGSYKDFMPNHYQVGYQIVAYADTKYNENIWQDVAIYGAKYPFIIPFYNGALRGKKYDTSYTKLLYETLDDLDSYWSSQPKEHNSATILETPIDSYTTYSTPVLINDTTIIAVKSDLIRSDRIVSVDSRSGAEQLLEYTGVISSEPVYSGDKLYWTQYEQSTFWEQKNFSVIKCYDIVSGEYRDVPKSKLAIYVAPMDGDDLAYVEYHEEGYFLIIAGSKRWKIDHNIEVHGLAYDSVVGGLYFLATGYGGMWIGCCTAQGVEQVTRPSYATLSRLKAKDGVLYFNSIASGKDEVHCYNINEGVEYRVSTSTYGSFGGFPSYDGKSIIMTTYADSKRGYMISQQPLVKDSMSVVVYSSLPSNRINPHRRDWGVMNIDSVQISTEVDETQVQHEHYHKGAHLFSIHSWAPMGFDPDEIVSESKINIHAGATIMSQNTLSTATGQLSYSWLGSGYQVAGKLSYLGWAPKLDVTVTHNSWQSSNIIMGQPKTSTEATLRAYLPATISTGYVTRYITPMVEFYSQYNNYGNGVQLNVHRLASSLSYISNVRRSFRDLEPRWGFAAKLSHICNPLSSGYSDIFSLFIRGYTPGLADNHSLMIRTSVQTQIKNEFSFAYMDLYPRGAALVDYPYDYGAMSLDYKFPLCYPDTGINSLLYFKRIVMNLTGDYGYMNGIFAGRHHIWSYGLDLTFDVAPIRLPPSVSTSFRLSVYKHSTSDKLFFGYGISLPI